MDRIEDIILYILFIHANTFEECPMPGHVEGASI